MKKWITMHPLIRWRRTKQKRGLASDDIKRTYVLWQKYRDRSAELEYKIKIARTRDAVEKHMPDYSRAQQMDTMLRNLFWISVNDTYKTWAKEVGMRAGWSVVTWGSPLHL